MDIKDLDRKNALIANASDVLKSEFVGIDEIIDSLLNNIRPWFLFPELQDRPLVVNLYGMTGCGKTSLVRRMVQLLDIEGDFIYFNFAEIGEMTSGDIENTIEENIKNDKTNRVIVYDEFQYAATLDGNGMEKDNKHGLKVFWELMDTGRLHKRIPIWDCKDFYKIVFMLQDINMRCPVNVVDGIWVNRDECMSAYDEFEKQRMNSYFNIDDSEPRRINEVVPEGSDKINVQPDAKFIFSNYGLKCINDVTEKLDDKLNTIGLYHKFKTMNFDEIIEFMYKVMDDSRKGYDLDFSNSIIFVIGNIDEAYEMCYDTDPDMSPDQFHNRSKKISIVDIKEALQRRFRNEQIARLGNIHLIYPSFSSETFVKIISMTLDKYSEEVYEKFGLSLSYGKKLKDFIYSESVFPTQGTRPVFSSIHEIIKSKLPSIIQYGYDNGLEYKRVVLDYSKGYSLVIYYDSEENEIGCQKIKETLRLSKLRETKKDDQQALVAVHESGHFVMYTMLYDKMPDKLCSRTTSTKNGGFMMMQDNEDNENNIEQSKAMFEKEIRVSLAGYLAERVIFGKNNITSGAYVDIRRATRIASKMVKEYGMSNYIYFTTNSSIPEINMDGNAIKKDSEKEDNELIMKFIQEAVNDVENAFKQAHWRNMLIESSKYLTEHSSMPKKVMKEIYERNIPSTERGRYADISYRKIVEGLKVR